MQKNKKNILLIILGVIVVIIGLVLVLVSIRKTQEANRNTSASIDYSQYQIAETTATDTEETETVETELIEESELMELMGIEAENQISADSLTAAAELPDTAELDGMMVETYYLQSKTDFNKWNYKKLYSTVYEMVDGELVNYNLTFAVTFATYMSSNLELSGDSYLKLYEQLGEVATKQLVTVESEEASVLAAVDYTEATEAIWDILDDAYTVTIDGHIYQLNYDRDTLSVLKDYIYYQTSSSGDMIASFLVRGQLEYVGEAE